MQNTTTGVKILEIVSTEGQLLPNSTAMSPPHNCLLQNTNTHNVHATSEATDPSFCMEYTNGPQVQSPLSPLTGYTLIMS